MVSPDMASIDPWSFRPSIMDPWFSEALSRDTQTLTKALTKSLTDSTFDSFFSTADCLASDPVSPLLITSLSKPEPAPTPAVSNVSGGSDLQEPATNKRQKSTIPASATSGKVSKRKPRKSKRSQTTFITTEPANFRQMVQQVTGFRFSVYSQLQAAGGRVLKPEPQRAGGQFSVGNIIPSGCLPTLDTSAFLLDNDQSNHQLEVGAPPTVPPVGSGAPLSYALVGDGGCAGGFDFDSSASFPTLESWGMPCDN